MYIEQFKFPAVLDQYDFKKDRAAVSVALFGPKRDFHILKLTVPVIRVLFKHPHSHQVQVIQRGMVVRTERSGEMLFSLVGQEVPWNYLSMKFLAGPSFRFQPMLENDSNLHLLQKAC